MLPIAASTTREKPKNPKCNSPHIIDADLLMQTIAEVLRKSRTILSATGRNLKP